MKSLLYLFVCIVLSPRLRAQQSEIRQLRFHSAHNCFPDTARNNGHLDGDGILQPKAGHYDDSSVLLVIPQDFHAGKTVDLIFWFHGWHNNIDTALRFYGLDSQFAAAHRHAVLVLPEAARNAADSYAGKMSEKGMFKLLVEDVVEALKKDGAVSASVRPGHILLAGHSGGFLAIANILENGQQPVDEVFLFDALYSHVNGFTQWAMQDGHHFVHWFTNKGYGPDKMSDTMMLRLKDARIPFGFCEEGDLKPGIIRKNRILFVHSPREHNVIINQPDDFALLLENSFFLSK